MNRDLAWGMMIGLFIAGCAGATYKTYNLEIPDGCYKAGHLLAHSPSDDLPLTVCQPDPEPSPGASPVAVNKLKCRVLQETEFVRFEMDLSTCQTDLKDCQASH
jgi:hypothetical protein